MSNDDLKALRLELAGEDGKDQLAKDLEGKVLKRPP